MPDNSNEPFDSSNQEQLARFRYKVAGAVRDLMTARRSLAPSDFDVPTITRWQIPLGTPNPVTLLENAAENFRKIRRRYCGYSDSVPCIDAADQSNLQIVFWELRDLIIAFSSDRKIRKVAEAVREHREVIWSRVASWGTLDRIRELLDRLPEQRDEGNQQYGPFPVFRLGPAKELMVRDAQLKRLSTLQSRLLRCFAEANRDEVEVATVVEKVWSEKSLDLSDDGNALRNLIKRVNKELQAHQVKLRLKSGQIDVVMLDAR